MKLATVAIRLACISSLAFFAPPAVSIAGATDRYVDPAGVDAGNDCSVLATPCATLQHANDQSVANDTVHVAAGLYTVAGLVTIDKTLTLLGAQAGVDARNRVAAESVLSNTQGISVNASNVVFDGFTIQDSSNVAYTNYGIWLNGQLGVTGTHIVNNIFQNNVAGLGLANAAAAQAIIRHNHFKNNNLSNIAASGTGIYTDQYVGGAAFGHPVSNVLIDENLFTDNKNAGIGFSNTDPLHPDSNITITNNVIIRCGRGVYFYDTQTATVTHNSITNLTPPTDGGTSVGVGVFGGVSDLSVLLNDIEIGPSRGIRIGSFVGSLYPNTNIEIHLNNIFGFTDAGMLVDDAAPSFVPAHVGSATFATCNWWGSATGPTNALLNPGGTGDNVKGDLIASNFNPWLLGLAPNAPCGATVLPLESVMSDEYTLHSWKPNVPDDTLVEVAQFTPPGGMIDFANDDITLQFAQEPANVVFSRFTIPAGTWTSYQGGVIRQVSSTYVDQITGHTLYAIVRITKGKPWRISINTKGADYTALEGTNHQRIRFGMTIGVTNYAGDQCFQRLASGDLYFPPRAGVVCQ